MHSTHDVLVLYRKTGDLRPLADIERDLIELAIQHTGGNMAEVARQLDIGRSTLYRKTQYLRKKAESS